MHLVKEFSLPSLNGSAVVHYAEASSLQQLLEQAMKKDRRKLATLMHLPVQLEVPQLTTKRMRANCQMKQSKYS